MVAKEEAGAADECELGRSCPLDLEASVRVKDQIANHEKNMFRKEFSDSAREAAAEARKKATEHEDKAAEHEAAARGHDAKTEGGENIDEEDAARAHRFAANSHRVAAAAHRSGDPNAAKLSSRAEADSYNADEYG